MLLSAQILRTVPLPLGFAESCNSVDVALAARLTTALNRTTGDPAERDLGGAPLNAQESVVAAAGKAAALAAAGDEAGGQAQLRNADALQRAVPTYYGGAWDALGRIILTTDLLGGCPPL